VLKLSRKQPCPVSVLALPPSHTCQVSASLCGLTVGAPSLVERPPPSVSQYDWPQQTFFFVPTRATSSPRSVPQIDGPRSSFSPHFQNIPPVPASPPLSPTADQPVFFTMFQRTRFIGELRYFPGNLEVLFSSPRPAPFFSDSDFLFPGFDSIQFPQKWSRFCGSSPLPFQ